MDWCSVSFPFLLLLLLLLLLLAYSTCCMYSNIRKKWCIKLYEMENGTCTSTERVYLNGLLDLAVDGSKCRFTMTAFIFVISYANISVDRNWNSSLLHRKAIHIASGQNPSNNRFHTVFGISSQIFNQQSTKYLGKCIIDYGLCGSNNSPLCYTKKGDRLYIFRVAYCVSVNNPQFNGC